MEGWLSLGAKTLAREGEETVCEGRGEGPDDSVWGLVVCGLGVCGLGRLADADDSAAIPAGVASTNLRFLDDGGVGM